MDDDVIGKPPRGGLMTHRGGYVRNHRLAMASIIRAMIVLAVTLPAWAPAAPVKLAGTGASLATMQQLADAFKKVSPGDEVKIIKGLGSKGATKALLADVMDISVMSTVGNNPFNVAGVVAQEFARTPLVFVAHADAPAGNLTLTDIVEIYSGRRTTWANGERLRLIIRNESDGDTHILNSMSAEMAEAVKNSFKREGISVAANDQEGADMVEKTSGGFGTNMLSLVIAEKRALKVFALDGVVPSAMTIANGSYRWFKTFHLVSKPSASPTAQRFMRFVFSAKGRQIAAAHQYWLPRFDGK